MAPQMHFNPRWREELVCSSDLGSFIVEMTMGVDHVYFPTETIFQQRAPTWAASYWAEIHDQLTRWCAEHRIPLTVEDDAQIYQDAK